MVKRKSSKRKGWRYTTRKIKGKRRRVKIRGKSVRIVGWRNSVDKTRAKNRAGRGYRRPAKKKAKRRKKSYQSKLF